jgi:putative ABC transport system permease protein
VLARPAYAVVQVSALSLGLLALVLLVLLRTDLIHSWQQASPANANNRFVINVQPDQGQAFQHALRAAGVQNFDWYPMFRGRLVAVNGRPIGPEAYTEERAQRLVEREFNLSHSALPPGHNRVVAGRWVAQEPDALSMEEGIAKTLGLKLGDRLRFEVAGQATEARITSLRKVDWSSMRANFFVMFPTAQPGDWPLTYLAAFRAPADPGFDNRLVQAFPNITSVDMGSTLAQVQQVLNQVIRAVEWLFGFTLAAGVLVLLAALGATREERARELAILRAQGAGARLLRQVQLGLGLLAGFLASVAAGGLSWLLARQVFEFDWALPLWLPLAGAAAGAVLAWLAGWWGLRAVLQRPVMQTLREAIHT